MKQDQEPSLRRVWKDRRGVVAILAALGIFAFVGFGAIVVDVAYVIDAHFALQAATNEAALAGAQDIGSGGTPLTTAKNYSAYVGDMNAISNITVAAPTVSITCLSGWGVACSTNQTPSTSANIIEVTETATVPVFFANLFHAPPWSISATAVASAKGGAVGPFNVAFILDTTLSMNSLSGGTTGTACAGFTRAVDCAASGIQTLLKELWPCVQGTCGTASPTPFDEVALFVFPPVTNSSQATTDISCTAPTIPLQLPPVPPWSSSGGAGYSGVLNTASVATTTSTLSLATSMTAALAFNTGSPWAVVTDAGTPTSATTISGKVLNFPSGIITAKVTTGLTVQDTTNPSAIASGTTVFSTTGTSVTLNKNVAATVNSGDWITFGTSIPAGTGSWPWWGTGTTISSVTLPTTAVMSASPIGADILKGDTIIAAPLYQIVGFGDDFGTSDPATTLNTSSNIVKVTKPGCLGAPGGLGTYYADAIGAAQSALVAEQTARKTAGQPAGTNVIILLSDGAAASSSAQMGPLETANINSECHAAITAAQNAAAAGKTVAAAGTWVFAIYFDDGSNTCSDTASITSCSAMQQIANTPIPTSPYYVNDPTKFFSTDGGSGTCPSTANPKYSTVANIFGGGIGGALTNARLIPSACVSASPPAGC